MRTLLLAPLLLLSTVLTAQTWEAVGSGTSSDVYALEPFGDDLYVGGLFTQAGGMPANYLARWNGTAWSTIGNLGNFMASDALYANDTALFVGSLGRVRWWNGTAWAVYPGVFNSDVYALTHFRDTLYAGGFFSSQSGVSYPHIARWNGAAWDSLTSGCNAQVSDVQPFHDKLFVGGDFQLAGDSLCQHTAWWDGAAWQRMGNGVNNSVYAHCIFHDTLYIGGRFTQANGQPASRVAKWNGTQFEAVGGTLNDYVTAMTVYRDQLYIGGAFTSPAHIARLSGHTWVGLGAGCDDRVRVLDVYHDTLFVGGGFAQAGGQPAANIAKWSLPAAPVAAFSVADPTLCTNGCTSFTDLSSNAPTAWNWSFPGGVPATSTEQFPSVCYAAPGTYSVTLLASNAGGSTAALQSTAVTVEVCTGVPGTDRPQPLRFVPEVFTQQLQLIGGDGARISSLAVFNALGARMPVNNTAIVGSALDTTGWPPGTYLLVATTSNGQVVRQRVVRSAR
ncbi:MAG TPA: PKD domain-containing protein [Flavobacteriales bacterium]|nr:PKD domain-containing protein [Flavobacteriales bacterium]